MTAAPEFDNWECRRRARRRRITEDLTLAARCVEGGAMAEALAILDRVRRVMASDAVETGWGAAAPSIVQASE